MKSKSNKPQFKKRNIYYMDRAVDTLEKRQKFLIVCEGKKTEPYYFEEFRAPRMVVYPVGTGMNTISLVKEAKRLKLLDNYDQVWCVFDKDDYPIDQFENAIKSAMENDMYVAYSNQAFELWYLLHFDIVPGAIDRNGYIKKLESHLGCKYHKNDRKMYQRLLCRREQAIKNAEKLLSIYETSKPGRDDPSTTVHQLVNALLIHSQPVSLL